MNKVKIHESLKNWGESKRKLPENNEALKSEVLAKVPLVSFMAAERRSLPWLSLAFTAIAIVVLIGSSTNQGTIGTTNIARYPGVPAAKETSPSYVTPYQSNDSVQPNTESATGLAAPNSDYYYDSRVQNLPITDTREFLKTYYNANIKTRDIPGKVNKIELAVRGSGGRVDNSRSGDEYGSVSFAVPSPQFFSFREEIRSLTGRKLIVENVSSENLLPEKQSIEANKEQIENSLKDLKNSRSKATSNHQKIISSYTKELNGLKQEEAYLQAEWQNATQERRMQISARLMQIQEEKDSVQRKINNENANYQNTLASINSQILNMEQSLGYVEKQDKNLLDNVATVSGTISLDKVSAWAIADIYVPGPLLFWILILAAVASYIRQRTTLGALI